MFSRKKIRESMKSKVSRAIKIAATKSQARLRGLMLSAIRHSPPATYTRTSSTRPLARRDNFCRQG